MMIGTITTTSAIITATLYAVTATAGMGGGGGYYGDRGNINSNRNTNISRDTNISGNEINIDRGGTFSQNNLKPTQRPAGWQPDQRHRRGQDYPEAVQKRLGRNPTTGFGRSAARCSPDTTGYNERIRRRWTTACRQNSACRAQAFQCRHSATACAKARNSGQAGGEIDTTEAGNS